MYTPLFNRRTVERYHFATGKSSKNRGLFYRCENKSKDPVSGCSIYPAYADPEGKELIIDTRWDLIEAGFFPEDSNLTLDQMKETLDSPCMIGVPHVSVKMFKPLPQAEILSTSSS